MRTALTTARTAVRQQYAVRGLSSIACQAPKPRAALRLPPPTLSRSTLRPPLPHLQPNRWLSSRPSSSSSKPSTDDAQPANVDGREAKTLLIVYHSLTGGAKQMATAAYDSAVAAAKEEWEGEADEAPPHISVRILRAPDAGPDDLLSASAYIFACPENLATMAGVMKDFFDRCFYPVLGKTNGRAYATLICAGSDGEGALRQLERICTGWRLKKAADGYIVITHAQTAERCLAPKTIKDEELKKCKELGAAMVEGLRLGVY